MAFLIIAFKNKIIYRSQVLFAIIGSVIEIYIQIAFWMYLYRNDAAMTEYMIMYTVLSNIISMFYINSITNKIGDKIINGYIAVDLLRPVHFLYSSYMQCIGEMCADLLLRGVPVLMFFGVYLWKYSERIVYQQMAAALAAVILGHILYMQIFMAIGLMAMALMETWAIHRIMNDIILFLSGAFIPLSLFPNTLYYINLFLPFRFVFSFPLELLLNETDSGVIFGNFGVLCGWIVLLGSMIWGMHHRMMRKLVIQGG